MYSLNTQGSAQFGGSQFSGFGAERISWGLLAAVTSIIVDVDPSTGLVIHPDPPDNRWVEAPLSEFRAARLFPPPWGRDPRIRLTGNASRLCSWIQDARGWPFLACWCELQDDDNPAPFGLIEGGIALEPSVPPPGGDPFETFRALPYRPIWRGLVLDTVTFAVAWPLLLFAPGFVRRELRRRRGLCLHCAYPRVGLAQGTPCPECGKGTAA